MCVAVAMALGHGAERVRQYQIACLLHDLGRAGLDCRLLGKFGPGLRGVGFRQDHVNGEPYTRRRSMGEKRRPFSGVIEMILRPTGL